MSGKGAIPSAWDDDWEKQADRLSQEEDQEEDGGVSLSEPMSKAERLARHEEENRKLWQQADSAPQSQDFPLLAAGQNTAPPLATPFKPAMKLLSRKPAPQTITQKDPLTGQLARVTLQDEEEEEERRRKAAQPSPEEIRRRQQEEFESKQRRYEEARAKIFGEPTPKVTSGASTPGDLTPPESSSSSRGGSARGRGRGRGRGRANFGANNATPRDGPSNEQAQGRPANNDRRPGPSQPPGGRALYDPGYSPKPSRRGGGEGSAQSSRSVTPRYDDQIIRMPRGPDGSGRGGFGFAKRGGRDV